MTANVKSRAAPDIRLLRVDPTDDAPLHGQIRLTLHDMIARGEYGPGCVLPGEQELARHFNVSRITVKRALNDLAHAGLVRRQRGRGTIVTFGSALPIVRGNFSTMIESLKQMGVETDVELLSVDDATPPADVADLLDLAPDQQAQRAVRLRRLDGRPFSHLTTFVPLDIAARYTRAELASKPLLGLLERAGAAATSAEQTIGAVPAPPEVATPLEVSPGSPLLHILRVMRDETDRAVQVIEAHYRPDQFRYHMKLTRRQSEAGDVWSDDPE